MNKEFSKGFSIGVISPLVTLFIYISLILKLDIDIALSYFEQTNTLTHHISLSVFFSNIILFFTSLKRNKQEISKGILGATICYAFIVLYIKIF